MRPLYRYTTESQTVIEKSVELVRSMNDFMADLEEVDLPKSIRKKAKALDKQAIGFLDNLIGFNNAFERIRDVFENTALYKLIAEKMGKKKEEFREAVKKQEQEAIEIEQTDTWQPTTSAFDKATNGGVGVDREMSL